MRSPCRVSVIINNYNYDGFLREAIDSALNQSYPDVEVIVVDDGSTDGSRDIISEYGHKFIPVLQNNGGQGSAFNSGFAASRGEIVCFLDADDGLRPEAMRQAALVFEDPGVVKVHWPLTVVDQKGAPTGALFPSDQMPERDLRATVLRDGPYYDSRTLPPTSGNAWRREFLERVLPMPAREFDHGADVYLHALAPLFGRMGRVLEPQGFYRAHDHNHYWQSELSDRKVAEYLGRFESCCAALGRHLAASGEHADEAGWRERNFNYLWLARLKAARQEIDAVIPLDSKYVLVDDDELAEAGLTGRRAIRFLERDGEYWGRPADDDHAIAEFERACDQGAQYLVFWWTCFWWLDHYAQFGRYLRSRFRCPLDNERLIVFDLTPQNGAHSHAKGR
jgi:glycosyltransferase involved in cell wall biosynthesis